MMACLLGRAQASLTLLSLRCASMKRTSWWLACSAEFKQAWLCPRCAAPLPTHLWTFVTWFQTIFVPKNEGRTTAHLLHGDFISGAKLLIVWELRNKKGWFLLGDGHIFLPTTARRFSRLGGLIILCARHLIYILLPTNGHESSLFFISTAVF